MAPDTHGMPGMFTDPAQSKAPLRAIALPPKHLRQWDDELVVYDQRCGETHLLQGAVTALFLLLCDEAHPIHELAAWLAAEAPAEIDDPEFYVKRVVRELHRLQLIEQAPPIRE